MKKTKEKRTVYAGSYHDEKYGKIEVWLVCNDKHEGKQGQKEPSDHEIMRGIFKMPHPPLEKIGLINKLAKVSANQRDSYLNVYNLGMMDGMELGKNMGKFLSFL